MDAAALLERIASSQSRISDMCSEGRPPRMRVPADSSDDDVYITETLNQCRDWIRHFSPEPDDDDD